MYRRITSLLVLLLVVALSASVAGAKTKGKKHKVSGTVQLATISTAGNFPAVGGTANDAGIVKLKPGGRGAETDTLKVTAAPTPTNLTLTGTVTVWLTTGTQTAKGIVHAVANPDGSFSYTGTGTYTKGTGIFKGITGKFTFTGASPPGSGIVTLSVKGTATY